MTVITLHLTPDEEAIAQGLVAEGRFASVEEVLRQGLRHLDESERTWGELWAWDGAEVNLNPDGTRDAALPGPPLTLEELREELRKGDESGYVPFEPEKWRAEWHEEWARRADRDQSGGT